MPPPARAAAAAGAGSTRPAVPPRPKKAPPPPPPPPPPLGPFCLLPSDDAAPFHAASASLLGALPAAYASAPAVRPRRGWRSRWVPPEKKRDSVERVSEPPSKPPPPKKPGRRKPRPVRITAVAPPPPPPPPAWAPASTSPLSHATPPTVVYRGSPFRTAARAAARTRLRVLFLEDGGGGRARVAAAAFEQAWKEKVAHGQAHNRAVEAVAASIATPSSGSLPDSLTAAALRAGLHLDPTTTPHQGDVIDADLSIVMDRYDADEARRDAAAADAMDRRGDGGGGFYAARVRRLALFAGDGGEDDIDDPFYGSQRASDEQLDAMVARIRRAARGLADAVASVCARCAPAATPPRLGLLSICLCPLLAEDRRSKHSLTPYPAIRTTADRPPPLWVEGVDDAADVYTLRRLRASTAPSPTTPYFVARARAAPRGYWKDVAAVDAALAALAPTKDRLPSLWSLRTKRATSVAKAVYAHGGLAAAAERLGRAPARRATGAWKDFDGLKEKLIEVAGESGIMPSRTDLKQAGLLALEHDIRRWGGSAAVARAAGLQPRRPPSPVPPATATDLKAALQQAVPAALEAGVLPGKAALLAKSTSPAAATALIAIVLRLGGFRAAADAAGLEYDRTFLMRPAPAPRPPRPKRPPRPGRAQRLAAAAAAAAAYAAASDKPTCMPTKQALKAAGRGDLVTAIRVGGGFLAVAQAAGLEWRETRGGGRGAS